MGPLLGHSEGGGFHLGTGMHAAQSAVLASLRECDLLGSPHCLPLASMLGDWRWRPCWKTGTCSQVWGLGVREDGVLVVEDVVGIPFPGFGWDPQFDSCLPC